MNDSKKREAEIDEQILGSVRSVLHFRITLPEDHMGDPAKIESATRGFVNAIIAQSKRVEGCTLNHRSSIETPDGFNIPLV